MRVSRNLDNSEPESLLALTPSALAERLARTRAGEGLTVADIEADISDGAPIRNGRINLLEYIAWLLRWHGYGDGGPA